MLIKQALDDGATGADLDPNLQLQQQRVAATPAPDTTTPPPPPPQLPAAAGIASAIGATTGQAKAVPTPTSGSGIASTISPTDPNMRANDVNGSVPANPATLSAAPPPPPGLGLQVNDAPPITETTELASGSGSSAPAPPSASQIFAADPNMPGSGYVMVNGQPVRIEGTTAAGLGPDGQPKQVTAQDKYILAGGQLSDFNVNPDDYNSFLNAPHAANVNDTRIGVNGNTAANGGTGPVGGNGQPIPGSQTSYLQNGLQTDANGNPVAGGYNALSDLYRELGVTPGTVNQQVIDYVKQNPALVNALPADQRDVLTRSLASQGITLPSAAGSAIAPGGPNDAGTPSSGTGPQIGSSVPLGGGGTGSPTSPGAAGAAASAPAGGPYTPGQAAIGSTILPNADPRLTNLRSLLDSATGQLGSVDRVSLAKNIFDQLYSSTDPQYQQDLRTAKQYAYGNGMGGSAGERDLYRNTFTTRQAQLDNAKKAIINDATTGSIADQFNKVSALSGLEGQSYGENANDRSELRGERGYQGSLEEQSFQRALEQYQQEQQDNTTRFNRGVTLTQLGGMDNPSQYLLQLAQETGVDPSVIAALAAQSGAKSVPAPPSH